RLPVEERGLAILATTGGEIALRDPHGRAMGDRRKLLEALVGEREPPLGLLEAVLLDERASEDELGAPDRVDEVDAAVEDAKRLVGGLLGERGIAGVQVDVRERRDGASGIRVVADVERGAERVLEEV